MSVVRSSACSVQLPFPRLVPSLSCQSDGSPDTVTVTGPPVAIDWLAKPKLMALPATPAGPTLVFTATAIVCGAELPSSPPVPSSVVLFAITVSAKFPALLPSCKVSLLPTSAPVSVMRDPLNTVLSAESVIVAPDGNPVIVTVMTSSESTGVTLIEGSTTVPPSFTVAVVLPSDKLGGSDPSPDLRVSAVPVPS